ncbi:MAG: hypothetical protein AAGB35_03340 [Pseudomonadota bacterium]
MLEISIFFVGVLVTLIALLMLFKVAYHENKPAAIVSLLLILPLIGYMFFNLGSISVRKAGFILVIGLIALIVSIYGGVSEQLHFLEENKVVQTIEEKIVPIEEEPLPNEQEAQAAKLASDDNYDPLLTGSEFEEVEIQELVPEQKSVAISAPVFYYQPLTFEEVQYALDMPVRLSMNDGSIIEGTLVNVDPEAILVESNASGGSVALSYSHADIKSVEVKLAKGQSLNIPQEDQIEEQTQVIAIEEDVVEEPVLLESQLGNETPQEVLTETIKDVEVGSPEQVEELIDEGEALSPVEPINGQ